MDTMSCLWRATGPFFFIAAPIMVALSYRKPASGGKSRDSCGAEDSYKRKLTTDDSSAYARVTSTEYDYVACMTATVVIMAGFKECEVVLLVAMWVYWWPEVQFNSFLTLVSGQLHAPAAFPPRKSRHFSLEKKLGELQSRSGRFE
jgi:hypothetical protein